MNDTNDTIDLRKLIDGLIDAREGERHIDPAAIAAEAVAKLGEAELRRVPIGAMPEAALAALRLIHRGRDPMVHAARPAY